MLLYNPALQSYTANPSCLNAMDYIAEWACIIVQQSPTESVIIMLAELHTLAAGSFALSSAVS